MSLLETITTPEALRALPAASLEQVARELRAAVLDVVSEKGGHLASNLGTVELTVALHYVFDTPRDKVVWDVGHQSYPHKILTGRGDRFSTIRQEDGLSGFTCRAESCHDPFGAGHASTSISAALGIAEGMRLAGLPHFAIAVIGDGAMTGGLAFEGLNNAGHIPAKNLLVVLNDNEMSIDPNVGALSKFVHRAQIHPGYERIRREVKSALEVLSANGVPLKGIASRARRSFKNIFTAGMLFECFGFRYLGPVDGHGLESLLEVFRFIRGEGQNGGPYLVHVRTTKGKGYAPAERLPLQYHGVSPFKVEVGITKGAKKTNYQDVFADTLSRLARQDPRIVAITAAMPSGTGLNRFQAEFPTRCYDVGIAEAHAVTFAAGLATEGYRPVVAIYSTFLQRAYDQVIHDVALQGIPVVFAMDRAGLVGVDGATHQGIFDLTYLRAVPGMVILAPKDENELQHMVKTAIDYEAGPCALRYPRGEVVGVPLDDQPVAIPIGCGELVGADAGELDVLFLGAGLAVQSALHARQIVRTQGWRTGLINARFIKPLDTRLLARWVGASRLIVTVEENTVDGGFGTAVLEWMQEAGLYREVIRLGVPDRFVEHAAPAAQRAQCGLDGAGIARAALERLGDRALSRRGSGAKRKRGDHSEVNPV